MQINKVKYSRFTITNHTEKDNNIWIYEKKLVPLQSVFNEQS